jgi:hypothetical protein
MINKEISLLIVKAITLCELDLIDKGNNQPHLLHVHYKLQSLHNFITASNKDKSGFDWLDEQL